MENKSTTPEIEKHSRALQEKLKRFLAKENAPDVLIIKAHLICEYYLTQVLILKESYTSNELYKLSFSEKLEKALDKADKIEDFSYKQIKKLNKLRNKIGHELEYSLSEADIDELGFLRGKEYIFEKYDYETLPDLLRTTLKEIIVNVSFIVFKLVQNQKSD